MKGMELIREGVRFAGIGVKKTGVGEVLPMGKMAGAGSGVRIVIPSGVRGDSAVITVNDNLVVGGMHMKVP
jgi:hypothetical protein